MINKGRINTGMGQYKELGEAVNAVESSTGFVKWI